MCFLSWATPVKLAPRRDWPARIDNQHSTCLSQEACQGEVEMNVFVTGSPAVALRLMGIEIVENDVDLAPVMCRHDTAYEIEHILDALPKKGRGLGREAQHGEDIR